MKINLLLLLLIVPMLVQAETIDEYVKNAQNNSMWANSTCGFVEPVLSYDADKLLESAFKSTSLDDGKPKKWEIIEHKNHSIHGGSYYLIRFIAFNKEHIFVFNLNAIDGKWCVRL